MISPVLVVDPGRAAELDAQDHQDVVEPSLGLEVCKRGDHRLVQECGLPWRAREIAAVGGGSIPDYACIRNQDGHCVCVAAG